MEPGYVFIDKQHDISAIKCLTLLEMRLVVMDTIDKQFTTLHVQMPPKCSASTLLAHSANQKTVCARRVSAEVATLPQGDATPRKPLSDWPEGRSSKTPLLRCSPYQGLAIASGLRLALTSWMASESTNKVDALHALQRLGLAGFIFFLAKGILWIAVPGILTFYGL